MKNAISSTKDNESKQNEQKQQINLFNRFQTYDQFKMRQVSAIIAENVGFTTASTSSLSVLSSLFKTYLEKLCRDAALFSFNNGREIDLADVERIFDQNSINLGELHDYLCQVGNFSLQEEAPLFPISSLLILSNVPTKPEDQNESAIENIEIVNDLIGKEDDKEAAEKERSDNQDQDQRNNMRVNQRIFPNFSNNYAQELGFIVKKIVPQTLEINCEQYLVKEPTQSSASFCIIKQDYFSVPVLNLKIEHQQIERHKEKKKKKKEKREQEESKGDERKKHHHHKEKERKSLKEKEELDNIHSSKDSSKLKVPKIKIRIGPAPIQGINSNLPSASSLSSPPKNVDSILQENAEIQKEIFIEGHSTKNIEKPEKDEIRPKTPLLIPPLKIKKSPPENEKKSIATPTPKQQSAEEKPKQQSNIISNQDKISLEISNEGNQSLQTVPIPSILPLLPASTQPTPTQKHFEIKDGSEKISSKKRNRKSDKPIRVDPIAAALFSSLESSPPAGNPPIQSKALESVLSETNSLPKKSKIPEPKKLSEPPMTVTETKIVKSGRNSAQEIIHLEMAPNKSKVKSKSKIPTTPSIPPISMLPAPNISQGEDEEDVWICPVCSVAYVENGPSMVGCDGCDNWYHWGCVGIFMAPPENSNWFCSECKKKQKRQQQLSGTSSRKSSVGGPPTKKQRRPSK